MRKSNRVSNWKSIIREYTRNNAKEYILVGLIFVIGLLVSVMFINNSSVEKQSTITTYISEFIEKFKNIEKIDKMSLVLDSAKNNIILSVIIWLAGTTIIGMPVVLGMILFRGFCLGYTVSALIAILGLGKGSIFFSSYMLLQNLIIIPCILALSVSGIKLYKSIVKDKRRENIKLEIIRHTLFSLIILVLLLVSSVMEAYISSNLFMLCVQYL